MMEKTHSSQMCFDGFVRHAKLGKSCLTSGIQLKPWDTVSLFHKHKKINRAWHCCHTQFRREELSDVNYRKEYSLDAQNTGQSLLAPNS
jgi:hypothetical protein